MVTIVVTDDHKIVREGLVKLLEACEDFTVIGDASDGERQLLQLIAEGLSSKEIAGELGVSLETVDSHRSDLMEKLDTHKVSGLVQFAIRSA